MIPQKKITLFALALVLCCSLKFVNCLKVRESVREDERKRQRIPLRSLHMEAILEEYDKEEENMLESIKHYFTDNNYIISQPRDLWHAMFNAFENVATGCYNGVCRVWDSCEAVFKAGRVGDVFDGVGQAAMLVSSGIAAAVYQLVQGSVNTPKALHESRLGKLYSEKDGVWEIYSLDKEDRQIEEELQAEGINNVHAHRTRQLRKRSKRRVKDMEYYRVLKVPSDASQAEIKRAYYREALHTHPDKDDSPKANEQFQKLFQSYQVLANEKTRELYDAKGKCAIDSKQQGFNIDPYSFFAVTFGSHKVQPYVGDLKIASTIDLFMNLGNDDTDDSEKKKRNRALDQKRRVVDVALFLRDIIQPFVDGRQTEVQFRTWCQFQATGIAEGEQKGDSMFADSFLIAIGRSIKLEAGKHFGKSKLASLQQFHVGLSNKVKSTTAVLQTLQSYAGPLMEAFRADTSETCGSSNGSEVLMEQIDLSKALEMLWQFNEADIFEVLSNAVDKVLLDAYSLPLKKRRAEGLAILGHVFYSMGFAIHNRRQDSRWKDKDALNRRMATAFEASTFTFA